jgi:hypothetical protein
MLCQALLEAFDASNVTSGMLWSLIQGWCGDVAAALAAHGTDVEPSVQLAANAAAGKWSSVVSLWQDLNCRVNSQASEVLLALLQTQPGMAQSAPLACGLHLGSRSSAP